MLNCIYLQLFAKILTTNDHDMLIWVSLKIIIVLLSEASEFPSKMYEHVTCASPGDPSLNHPNFTQAVADGASWRRAWRLTRGFRGPRDHGRWGSGHGRDRGSSRRSSRCWPWLSIHLKQALQKGLFDQLTGPEIMENRWVYHLVI